MSDLLDRLEVEDLALKDPIGEKRDLVRKKSTQL